MLRRGRRETFSAQKGFFRHRLKGKSRFHGIFAWRTEVSQRSAASSESDSDSALRDGLCGGGLCFPLSTVAPSPQSVSAFREALKGDKIAESTI